MGYRLSRQYSGDLAPLLVFVEMQQALSRTAQVQASLTRPGFALGRTRSPARRP